MNCEGHDDLEEPLVRFVPDTTPLTLSAPDCCAATLTLTADATPLARSIAELAHGEDRTRVLPHISSPYCSVMKRRCAVR